MWTFPGFEDVTAGIVRWPMSCIRLSCHDDARLVELGGKILAAWREYTDEASFVYAYTDGVPHNTITPIARKRGENFELDLVLRNNITTAERPMGLYHPGEKLHHIKKENIGLIEVMGLAVLPSRLKAEMATLADALVAGTPVEQYDETIAKHGIWAQELAQRYTFTRENVDQILQKEVGLVFAQVLEDAGVYKLTKEGREGFLRFLESVK
jgi:UDPglucose--hexose-1-phosphate uridylyltransferase